jgi:GMP synthase (glutamine-hydrolysing)
VAVFGGSMNADDLDAHPYLAPERAVLRHALDEGVPMLGVCLGAQVLARVLGAPVRRAPQRELGFYRIELTEAGRQEPMLGPFAHGRAAALVFQWHEDSFELPTDATLLATDRNGLVQAYRVGSAVAVQFHPEVTADELEAWFDEVGEDRVERAWGTSRKALRDDMAAHMSAHNERGRELFRRFARSVRQTSLTRRP